MTIVVLRTGDALADIAPKRGEFARWIQEAAGTTWDGDWREHDVRHDGPMPVLEGVAAFIITGSSSSVTERAPWMLRTEELIRGIHGARIPLLGICFGHQIVAQALGGLVTKNPHGREIGTVRVRRAACPIAAADGLFTGLGDEFQVNSTHVDTVARLPEGGRVLCSTSLEPTAAYAVGDTTRGVQFHPEIDGEVMRAYVKARAHLVRQEGLCPDTIHAGVHDAPDGAHILRNFVRGFVAGRRRRAA